MCLNDCYNDSEDKKVSSYSFTRPKQKQLIKLKMALQEIEPENVLFAFLCVCLEYWGSRVKKKYVEIVALLHTVISI